MGFGARTQVLMLVRQMLYVSLWPGHGFQLFLENFIEYICIILLHLLQFLPDTPPPPKLMFFLP